MHLIHILDGIIMISNGMNFSFQIEKETSCFTSLHEHYKNIWDRAYQIPYCLRFDHVFNHVTIHQAIIFHEAMQSLG